MNESNALLADQFGQHDERAFAKLMSRHHSLVFRICLRMLGHRQDAEDATQETFTRVAKYLDRWDRRRPLEPWLVTIAGNRCRTLLSKKRVHLPLRTTDEPLIADALEHRAAESLREEIQLALLHLPPNQRRALELFHQHALGYAQIAAELNCPLGTAKTWVHRARATLLESLRDRDVVNTGRNASVVWTAGQTGLAEGASAQEDRREL